MGASINSKWNKLDIKLDTHMKHNKPWGLKLELQIDTSIHALGRSQYI